MTRLFVVSDNVVLEIKNWAIIYTVSHNKNTNIQKKNVKRCNKSMSINMSNMHLCAKLNYPLIKLNEICKYILH